MKCPQCEFDQKSKDGLTCGGCGYRFTFNPRANSWGLSDGKFLACVRSASQNDTTWFTENQLYATFCKRMAPAYFVSLIGGTIAIMAGLVFYSSNTGIGIVLMVFGAIYLVFAVVQKLSKKTTPAQFDNLLKQWLGDGKKIEKLLDRPTLHQPPPEWSEPDIYDYGVERLLIVERDLLVDLLVKNGVHAEQRMLVISESGYPDYLLPVAARLLAEQPELPVFLLHDATDHGTQMRDRVLAAGRLPLDPAHVVDLGMFPDDFRRLKRTTRYDPKNHGRQLPVDAMLLPFMIMGLGAAIAEGMTLRTIIDQQLKGEGGQGGYDFG